MITLSLLAGAAGRGRCSAGIGLACMAALDPPAPALVRRAGRARRTHAHRPQRPGRSWRARWCCRCCGGCPVEPPDADLELLGVDPRPVPDQRGRRGARATPQPGRRWPSSLAVAGRRPADHGPGRVHARGRWWSGGAGYARRSATGPTTPGTSCGPRWWPTCSRSACCAAAAPAWRPRSPLPATVARRQLGDAAPRATSSTWPSAPARCRGKGCAGSVSGSTSTS